MTFPASVYATPSITATAMAGSYADLVVSTRGILINADGPIGRRIAARLAVAYDEAWCAWYRLADEMVATDELVDALTSGPALEFEPESESVMGEWLKDEHGIPYFRPFGDRNPFLDDDYVDGTAMYGNHAIV